MIFVGNRGGLAINDGDGATGSARIGEHLEISIERRLQAAQDQIASAEQGAVKQVRDEAARIAVAAAGQVVAKEMSAAKSVSLIDDAIKTVEAKLH